MQIRFIGPWVGLIRGLAVAAVAFMPAIDTSATPPANDNFADRIIIQQPPPGGSIMVTGTLNGATVEQGEFTENIGLYYTPVGIVPNKSVWWELVMTNSGIPVVLEIEKNSEADKNNYLFDYSLPYSDPLPSLIPSGFAPARSFYQTLLRPQLVVQTNYGVHLRHYLQVIGTDDQSNFRFKLTTTNLVPWAAQPVSQTVLTNGSVLFSAFSIGVSIGSDRRYQWRQDGVDLPGETGAILALNHVTTNQAGDYSVVLTNANLDPASFDANGIRGSILMTSVVAHLTVLETNLPLQLQAAIRSNSSFSLFLNGNTGRSYRVESSINLTNWQPENSFLNGYEYFDPRLGNVYFISNGLSYVSLPVASTNKFFRAAPYIAANEVCNNNLKRIRFAKECFKTFTNKPGTDSLFPNDQFYLAYFFNGVEPVCPDGGTYSPGDLGHLPTCSIPGHVLEEPR